MTINQKIEEKIKIYWVIFQQACASQKDPDEVKEEFIRVVRRAFDNYRLDRDNALGRPHGLPKADREYYEERAGYRSVIARKVEEGCTWDEAVRSLPSSEQGWWIDKQRVVGWIAVVLVHSLVESNQYEFGCDPIGFKERVCQLLSETL